MKKILPILLSFAIISTFTITGYTSTSAEISSNFLKSSILTTEAPTSTPVVTDTPTPVPSSSPLSGSVTVNNDAELANVLAWPSVTEITFAAGMYAGFTINHPVIINGGGADVTSGITINASNVTINNLDVTSSSSLTSVPSGEADYYHAYLIGRNLSGITISGGTVNGVLNTNTKGIYFQTSAGINDSGTAATLSGIAFNNLRNGVVCGGSTLTITNNTFSSNRVGIGSTEDTTFTACTGNSFTNLVANTVEGISLADGVAVIGQTNIVSYLLANNTFDAAYEAVRKCINDYREGSAIGYPTPPPPISFYITAQNDAYEIGNVVGRFYLYSELAPGFYADGYGAMPYTVSGTAVNGVDYELIPGYVNVLVGYNVGGGNDLYPYDYIDIVPKANGLADGDKTVIITFCSNTATLTIHDGGTLQEIVHPLSTYNALLYSTAAPWSGTTYLQGMGYSTSEVVGSVVSAKKYTGKVSMQYDITPSTNNLDESVGYADGDILVENNDDLSIQVRLNSDGYFDARNAGTYSNTNNLSYTAGISYHVDIIADMSARTYNVWVTPTNGTKTLITYNYAFRNGGDGANADDIGQVFFVKGQEANSYTISNHMVRPVIGSGTYGNVLYTPITSPYTTSNFLRGMGLVIESPKTGTAVTINLDVTPLAQGMDTLFGFADSSMIQVAGYNDLSMLVAFTGGLIKVRNASSFQYSTPITYVAGTVYHFELVANMFLKTYSVWCTPAGGTRTQIAADYGFRTGGAGITADDIGQVYFTQAIDAHDYTVANFTIADDTGAIPSPSPQLYTLGDINSDGGITSTDALLTLRISTSKLEPTSLQSLAANVNGSDSVTSTDALLVLRRSTGKITKFPIEY